MPFKETLEEYLRLENDGRDKDRQLQEDLGLFLLDFRAMLDILNSSLRSEPQLESSPLGQRLTTSIATLRAGLNELNIQERLS
jgi:hypothetical protein